jgi:hypothetical protein
MKTKLAIAYLALALICFGPISVKVTAEVTSS